MNKLKLALITASALMFINYSEEADKIIVDANDNETEWEDTLSQVEKEMKKRYSVCYKSRFWSDTKKSTML